jgi:hypothetical protein
MGTLGEVGVPGQKDSGREERRAACKSYSFIGACGDELLSFTRILPTHILVYVAYDVSSWSTESQ